MNLSFLTIFQLHQWRIGCVGALGLLIPVVIYLVALRVFRGIPFWYFDPKDRVLDCPDSVDALWRKDRTFEPTLARYTELTKQVIALSVGSIALLSGYVSYVWQKKPESLSAIQEAAIHPLLLLSFSVLYAVLFLFIIYWRYELYLYDRKCYSNRWAALVWALALSTLFCFALGYGWIGFAVLNLQKP